MGRQNKDPAVVGSSIMLLQERFKQLQRLKEMRQETQMLRLMPQEIDRPSSSSSSNETNYQDPLSLGLNFNSHHTPNFRAMNPQQFPAVRGTHNFFEIPDVDTSLRL